MIGFGGGENIDWLKLKRGTSQVVQVKLIRLFHNEFSLQLHLMGVCTTHIQFIGKDKGNLCLPDRFVKEGRELCCIYI